jgi:GAF domain-containing protein
MAAVLLADNDGFLTIRAHVGLVDDCVARWRIRAGDGPFGSVSTKGRPHIVTDAAYLEKLAPDAALKGLLLVPLKIGKTIVGCFAVGYRDKRKLTKRDLQLASLFASYASIGIETSELFEREREARKRSDTLLNVVETPRPGLTLKSVLTKLSHSVLKLSRGERCAIFILSEDGKSVESVLALGGKFPLRWNAAEPYSVSDLDTPKLLNALQKASRKPIIEEHVKGPGLVPDRWLKRFKVRSIAAYPLT